MTSPGLFLCGCDPNSERIKTYRMSASALQQGVMSFKRHDPKGREICPIHGKQLYGHLTEEGPYSHTELKNKDKELGSPNVKDIRDNSDPTELGNKILSQLNGKGNINNEVSGDA